MKTSGYADLLDGIKARVRSARFRAAAAVNSELVQLYWNVGRDILKRQLEQGWGAKVVDRLSGDLTREFPDMRGFSPRNLKYMLAFARTWAEESIVQSPIAQLTWTLNVVHMIPCRSKNRMAAEYSQHATDKPIGVASHTLDKELPREMRGVLPAPEGHERVLREDRA